MTQMPTVIKNKFNLIHKYYTYLKRKSLRKKHTKKVKVWFVFHDWLDPKYKSVTDNDDFINLRMGSFHEGSAFSCELKLVDSDVEDLQKFLDYGFVPTFYISEIDKVKKS